MRKIGVLTSGGDAPGMNAAVMAVAKAARHHGVTLVGIKRGYNGALNIGNGGMAELDLDTVLDIADQPGTYLRTARCLEFLRPEMQLQAANNIREMGIEGVVVIGGDGSFKGAQALCNLGIPCVGIPGTIDNDLHYTEMTLGYDSAVNSCVEDIRAIRATSRSHDRPAVVEVMGRHCGDIALKAAAGTGAEICVVPEVEWSITEVADRLSRLIESG
ncbi:MAG: ATP-dependent 6-phosphofructokinase, partial [Clostridia bacterium]|nr:ATP-dependent 6-phosphofructokinase [Clostridia bacterium]